MGFARQEYWSVLPFPSPGDPPNPGMQPESPAGLVDSLLSHLGSPTQIYIQVGGEAVETMRDFILGGSKNTADGDCNHEIKRHLLLGRKL